MFLAADLFCGAGGSSTGLVAAAGALDVSLDLLAVNHWPVAVDTHCSLRAERKGCPVQDAAAQGTGGGNGV